MPIRVNLKEIFPSDPQEINVDKVNFNFNKLLELGVGSPGPIGLTGPAGPAGPIGLIGPQGDRGATWWVDSGNPNTLTFTGLIDGDLYLDQTSTAFEVYQYDDMTSTWNSVVSIATIVNTYLSTVSPSPFTIGPTGIPATSTKFVVFDTKGLTYDDDYITDNNRGSLNQSKNKVLFLTNFDENIIDSLPIPLPQPLLWPVDQNSLYTSIFKVFANHSDAQLSSFADIGRYHLEFGSLYNDGTNTLLSDLKHNLKGKFYKRYIGLGFGELLLTNEWINTAKFSLSVPEEFSTSQVDQNGEFEFVVPKYNNESVLVRDELSVRIGAWESQVEHGPSFNYILADGISFSLRNSETRVTNIGIATNYQSAYTEIDNMNLFMLDANSQIDGILLNKDTYTVGDFQVFGKTTTENFRMTYSSGTIGQQLMSIDSLGNAEWGDHIISIDRQGMIGLIQGELLIPGMFYEINDSQYQDNNNTCSIYVQALTDTELSPNAIRKQRIVKNSIYVNNGIWKPGRDLVVDDLVIWGGRAWTVDNNHTSSTTVDVVNNTALGANYTLEDLSVSGYYEDKLFKVIYKFNEGLTIIDWVTTQYDDRGNVFNTQINKDYSNAGLYSGSIYNTTGFPAMTNPIDYCDYGDARITDNQVDFIVNNAIPNSSIINKNTCEYIVNNHTTISAVSGSIISNSCLYILNNKLADSVSYNSNSGPIDSNECGGSIIRNSNGGQISTNKSIQIWNNSNTSYIVGNENVGYISDNSNDGYIANNGTEVLNIYGNFNKGIINHNGTIIFTDVFSIYNNSNSGSIENNEKIWQAISNNSNLEKIKENINFGLISNNSNRGKIEGNECINGTDYSSNHILNNSNDGNIEYNKLDANETYGNNSGIQSNSNDGDISSNCSTGIVTLRFLYSNSNIGPINNNLSPIDTLWFNSNKGAINGNRVSNIAYNSNLGEINENEVINIRYNSNNGRIYTCSNDGSIEFNKNAGDIRTQGAILDVKYNINLGNIVSAPGSPADIIYLGLDGVQIVGTPPYDYP